MKTGLIIGSVVLVAVVALSLVGFAYAQRPAPFSPTNPMGGYGMVGGYGHMGGYGMMGGYGSMHDFMLDAFAQSSGLSVEEIESRLVAGESMWEIAQAQGLSDEQVYELMEQAHETALETAVDDGVISQEQAEWMDEHMDQMHSGEFEFGGCHGSETGGFQGRGPGMRWNLQSGS
jgi:hypothetical protein